MLGPSGALPRNLPTLDLPVAGAPVTGSIEHEGIHEEVPGVRRGGRGS